MNEPAIKLPGGQCFAFLPQSYTIKRLGPAGPKLKRVSIHIVPQMFLHVFGFHFDIKHETWEVPGRGWVVTSLNISNHLLLDISHVPLC